MTSKDLICNLLDDSLGHLFRNARSVPDDKLNWTPGGATRSVLSMVQECVQAPQWTIDMLATRSVPSEFSADGWEKIMAERAQWDTVDKCETECRARCERLKEAIRAFPDSDLEQTMFLPFTDKHHPFWDIMMYPYWNNTWHTGQIAYVQMELGDKEMH